jgi:hypothetical protein
MWIKLKDKTVVNLNNVACIYPVGGGTWQIWFSSGEVVAIGKGDYKCLIETLTKMGQL